METEDSAGGIKDSLDWLYAKVSAVVFFGEKGITSTTIQGFREKVYLALKCSNIFLVLFEDVSLGVFMNHSQIRESPYLKVLLEGKFKEQPSCWISWRKSVASVSENKSEEGARIILCSHPCSITTAPTYPYHMQIEYMDTNERQIFFRTV